MPQPRLTVVGHSVAEGGGASTPARRYTSVLAGLLGLEESNHAVGGAITCWDQGGRFPGDGGWERVVSSVAPDSSIRACVAHFGLNDLPILGPENLRPLQEALRTVLVHLRAGTVGRPARWRRSVSFAGPHVDVVVGVRPSFDGVVSVVVDGEETPFTLRGADVCDTVVGRRNGITLSVGGLGEGEHSLAVTGGPDFVSWSVPSEAPPLVVVPLGHRVLDWGWYAGWPHTCVDADVPVLNAALRSAVDEFASPDVLAFDFDPLLDRDPSLFAADRFYPNDEGHARIAAGLADLIRSPPVRSAPGG
jgi:hypothetical protein